ncbi:MAG: hypothetical protein IT355_17965 [Gemmatimonadaceae bacterium]|nr:hypothetical protein [Gemmatimonadaceae bacterium]
MHPASPFPEPSDVFGCLRRFISLVILAVVAVAAFATRDLWLPRVRQALGDGGRAPGTAADSSGAPADTGWKALSFVDADKGRRALDRIARKNGPAYVSMTAADFAAAVLDSLGAQLPASADSVQVRAVGSEFQIRATVRLGDLGGRAVLGPLASMVGDRERLTLGGSLEPGGTPGVAQFRLTRVKIGDFPIPAPVVPKLVSSLNRRPPAPGIDPAAMAIRLPAGVGDIRVAQGRITIYRATP